MARKSKRTANTSAGAHPEEPQVDSPPRIIGGQFRGRKLAYSGDSRTRPMKDRVREAVFNLLGPSSKGRHAVDLFAGTGALGLEALSRGAAESTFVEQHFPTADLIEQNADTLAVGDRVQVVRGNVFRWAQRPDLKLPNTTPWLVFVSPPWDFFVERSEEMLTLINSLIERAPPQSLLVVETDERFDSATLPQHGRWDVRPYPPAFIHLLQTPPA